MVAALARWAGAAAALLPALAAPAHAASPTPPPGYKVAFIGDQGSNPESDAVLQLIADEGADAVVHAGDFDYEGDPAAWEARIDRFLGPDFPYFAAVGNHDVGNVYGEGGYQWRLQARLRRLGISWEGDLGVRSSHAYQGLFFVLTAPGVFGDGDGHYDHFIRDALAGDDHVWRVSCWHKNMRLMQVGGKGDETGWGVYEASRRGGAIVATGHEHSYSRSVELHDIDGQRFDAEASPIVLRADRPETPADEGTSFVFVSGIAGKSVRDQEIVPTPPWWGAVYTSDQGAESGALFGGFHVRGDPRRAHFYFKDIGGRVVDEFDVRSTLGALCDTGDADGDGVCDPEDDCTRVRNPSQLDADADGYGNACDADYDNDGTVGAADLAALRGAVGRSAGEQDYRAVADRDGDGRIGAADARLLFQSFGRPPGPSGLGCAGAPPCPGP